MSEQVVTGHPHTPGPWIAGVWYQRVVRSNDSDGSDSICHVYGEGDEVNANAALIAAAPDLLEACLSAIELLHNPEKFPDCQPTYFLLKSAVHKASSVKQSV